MEIQRDQRGIEKHTRTEEQRQKRKEKSRDGNKERGVADRGAQREV